MTSAFALSLGALPLIATPAAADHLIDIGVACDNAPDSSLNDAGSTTTPAGETDWQWVIDCLNAPDGYESEDGGPVLNGTADGNADFSSPVKRDQFAGIFARIMEATGNATNEDASTPFEDIDGLLFEGAIAAMYDLDLTAGTTATTYTPKGSLSVAQLSTFFRRLVELILDDTLATDDDTRVTNTDGFAVHADNMEALYDNGILTEEQADNGGRVATRGDIFAMAARVLGHMVNEGILSNPFPVPTNETIALTPDTDVNIEGNTTDEATSADDDRSFSATGLDNAKKYTITLVDSDNVTDTDGVFSFVRAGAAVDPGTVLSTVVIVNGTAAAAPGQTITGISPVNGAINFTVDGHAVDGFHATIREDGTFSADTNGLPTVGFGISGMTNVIFAEQGNAVFNQSVTQVGDGFAVGTSSTVYFNAADNYRIQDGGFCVTATAAKFFQNLSVGDSLATVDNINTIVGAPYNPDGANTFCLFDVAPVGASALTATLDAAAPDTTVDLAWTAEAGIDSQRIYRATTTSAHVIADDCETLAESAYTLVATVANTIAVYEVTGLAPEASYCFWVASVSGTDQSTISAGGSDGATMNAGVVAPTITDARLTTDAVVEGHATTGDVWTLTFNEEMAPGTVAGALINLTDADGDTIQILCDADGASTAAASAEDGVTEADCELADGTDLTVANDVLTVTLAEDAEDRNAGGNSTVSVPSIDYVLTITSITVLKDLNDGVSPNVAGSADKIIDVEA